MLSKLIDHLSHELSIEDRVTQTEDHHYILPLDEEIEVEAIEQERSHLLKAVIGPSPKENVEAFLMKTMEANLFGMGTRGAVIGLSDDGKLLTLSMELDYNSSFKDFQEKMEDFVSVLDFWRQDALRHT